MYYRQFKYKFYLNMNHSVQTNGEQGEIHSHTWEVGVILSIENNEFALFSDIEKQMESFFEIYQDKYLNSIAPFNIINPTLENVCDYLFEKLTIVMRNRGWRLLVMEMSETPSRIYQVSNPTDTDDFSFVQFS